MPDKSLDELRHQFDALMQAHEAIGQRRRKPSVDREYAFRFLEEYAQWRYEHRGLALLLALALAFVASIMLIGGAWGLADTAGGKALGLDSAKLRVTNAYYAVMWATSSTEGSERDPVKPQRFAGSIEKVIGDMLVIVYYDKGQQIRKLVKPANVIVTDKAAFARWADAYKLKGVSVDFYQSLGEVSGYSVWAVVLWYRKTPINVELVEKGIGVPEKNPPTAVVNEIFSLYYWKKAKAGA